MRDYANDDESVEVQKEETKELVDILRRQKHNIIGRWLERVLADPHVPKANNMAKPTLVDHIPQFVDEITKVLADQGHKHSTAKENSQPLPQGGDAAKTHARTRAWQGYAIPEALIELSHLRASILETCLVETMSARTLLPLHASIDQAMSEVAEEIADSRHNETLTAKAELDRVNQVKDLFIATLSHELRTPLGVISGYVDLLKSAESIDDPTLAADALDAIDRNVKIQTQLVDDLLDMSRILAGKMSVDLRSIDLATVIESAATTLRPLAKAKHVLIRTSSDKHVGKISGDPDRLQQVIWNLLTNAIKFSASEGVVELILTAEPGMAVIIVKDHGRGIPLELLPFVFDRFRQADDKANRKHGGLGLGLALVRHLVELHHGTVEAQSDGEGKGATMIVRLPLLTA